MGGGGGVPRGHDGWLTKKTKSFVAGDGFDWLGANVHRVWALKTGCARITWSVIWVLPFAFSSFSGF